jgi:hypothetical protein
MDGQANKWSMMVIAPKNGRSSPAATQRERPGHVFVGFGEHAKRECGCADERVEQLPIGEDERVLAYDALEGGLQRLVGNQASDERVCTDHTPRH